MQYASRVRKELKEVESESSSAGVSARLLDGKLNHWKGEIKGPEDTPYQGGTFVVDIQIPDNYPFVPPKMRFDTKIWHPNVSSANGAICLDILKDEWSPALTMRTALLSLQALLFYPNPSDPQDAQVAAQYKKSKKEWEATAKFWTQTYAMKGDGLDTKVKQLMEMGFPEEKAKEALKAKKGDLNAALTSLFSAS
uniref:E2 ubiquitin-conjugating enzyme n=1 Tax=Lotharella globosa TaxID=91324 RepID=A0A6V3JCS0_9EUKA|mmetsp:Transcript_1837/g.3536  ORF Transcript_1837/g.3536 Transcript_1837/m.3536 type:complete len:195 (-) Transcript_1837:139-723(-)|eukprot:CAMPEP_0167833892 /NCGR_PEP_ID=MMETSP0112_2-20121227/15305_1 /TAXON_ID=91324 /ORGANISM="Lotharella globosa, Strain CCCM811" /LENGTH=194 /DNA_ID=CAMNT_0007739423 /DNA_START=1191 /DNA_END=1775 /DNA_ORIENTATION=+